MKTAADARLTLALCLVNARRLGSSTARATPDGRLTASNIAWGTLMIGFPRWHVGEGSLASEYTHYEAGVARTIGRPMLMVQEKGAPLRGAYDPGSSGVCVVPADADEIWLTSAAFQQSITTWLEKVRARYDVFLGYSSQAEGVAQNLKRMMVTLGATVLDWQDFGPGTVLEQIGRASDLCTGGVFLFTRDDILDAEHGRAAPRDNVVFEAGYFVNAKRQRRVLIVLEAGAKLPADLGARSMRPWGTAPTSTRLRVIS